MFIRFNNQFLIKCELSEDMHQYLRMRYFGFTLEHSSVKETHIIRYGERLTDKFHEVIRPPVAKSSRTFLFDTLGNTLTSNLFENPSDEVEIYVSPNFNVAFLCNFVEYMYYLHLCDYGKTIIHCSAFQINNVNYICPAGRNTGKTNILLDCLAHGGKYLADDWLIYGSHGELEIFPKAINIQSYNVPTARNFDKLSSFFNVFENLDELCSITPFFSKQRYSEIVDQSQLFIPYQKVPFVKSDYSKENKDKKIFVWLTKGELEPNNVNISKVSSELVVNHILATRKIEHYPFELWKLITVGSDGGADIRNDKLDFSILQNISYNAAECYKVNIPSQSDSSNVMRAIRTLCDEC